MTRKKTARTSEAGAAERTDGGFGATEGPDIQRRLAEFAEAFKEHRRKEVAQIAGHVAEGRFDLIARLGHQIKGTAATFGLAEIGSLGSRLETVARAGDAAGVLAVAGKLRSLLE